MGDYNYTPLDGSNGVTALQKTRFVTPVLAVYSIVVTLAFIISITFNQRVAPNCDALETPRQMPMLSDFKSKLQYETETPPADAWDTTIFSGEPNPQNERAWHQLLHGLKHGYGVKITASEADELGFVGYTQLEDGRVLSAPAVYHIVHCLRRIRQNLYADHYYPNITAEQSADNRHHSSHCLSTILSSVRCNPDLSLLRVTKSDHDKEPFKAMPAPVQRCVNWDSLIAIVDSRTT